MRKTIVFGSMALLLIAGSALANTASSTASTTPEALKKQRMDAVKEFQEKRSEELKDKRLDIKDKRDDFQDNFKDTREDLRISIKSASTTDAKKDLREDFWAKIKQDREKLHEEIKNRQEAAKSKLESERAKLKEKLAVIRDAQKKITAERIYDRLGEVNKKMVNHFTNVAERLEDFASKLQDRITNAKNEGRDVTGAQAALDKVKPLITELRTMIQTQAGKTYSVNVTSENQLESAFRATRDSLHSDLGKIHDKIVVIRKAFADVLFALSNSQEKTATSTPSTSTTTQSQ